MKATKHELGEARKVCGWNGTCCPSRALIRCDLATYRITELKRMVHFVHRVGETLAEANITLDVAVLTDLEGAVSDELGEICNVLNRVECRIGRELAKRN